MKIILTGATGLVGNNLFPKLDNEKHQIIIFSRNPERAEKILPGAAEYVYFDYNKPGSWQKYLENSQAVIHLAGANLAGKRWSDSYKKVIYDSRIVSTKRIVQAIGECTAKPKVFIHSSAVGIYGDRGDEELTESSLKGNDFLANLCSDWESEAKEVEKLNVRRVSLRIGIVLSKEGGALKQFITPFKLFLGGPLGNGKQWFPWIHIDDLTNIILFSLKNESIKGAVNCASPGIVTMKDFANTLGRALKRPAIFSAPKFALKIIIGEMADAIVAGQKIAVDKLLDTGFQFEFENLEEALKDLLKKQRRN